MRRLVFLMCFVAGWAATEESQLRKLYDTDRMFELRRALIENAVADEDVSFYRAAVEARFGHEAVAIDQIARFVETHPDSQLLRKASKEMAGAFERLGRYADAARGWSEALRREPADAPDRADDLNTQRLYETLRDVPAQTVTLDDSGTIQAQRNGLGTWNVPVNVNGHSGEWIFDTGANLSTITESEARRMKLTVRDTATYVSGSTGKKNPLRLAVAMDLRFGGASLRNVVFLVLSDQALYVGPVKYQINGILGLPVIRALGCINMSPGGLLRIEKGETDQQSDPNLFFQELTPLVASRHGGRDLQMFLDTGNNTTFLYPSARQMLNQGETANLRKKREQMGGAGGTTKRSSEIIPALRFEIFGKEVELKDLSLISKQPSGESGYRDGVFGADVLENGFRLDFRSMTFRPPAQ